MCEREERHWKKTYLLFPWSENKDVLMHLQITHSIHEFVNSKQPIPEWFSVEIHQNIKMFSKKTNKPSFLKKGVLA